MGKTRRVIQTVCKDKCDVKNVTAKIIFNYNGKALSPPTLAFLQHSTQLIINQKHLYRKTLGSSSKGKNYEKKIEQITNRQQAEKTTGNSRRHNWFSRKMTTEKRAQKFHTNDASLLRSGQRCTISMSQTLFRGKTSGGAAKCRLFSQAKQTTNKNKQFIPRDLNSGHLPAWQTLQNQSGYIICRGFFQSPFVAR